jgi:hypothetical protein
MLRNMIRTIPFILGTAPGHEWSAAAVAPVEGLPDPAQFTQLPRRRTAANWLSGIRNDEFCRSQ